jgi:hypothetical protein
MSNTRKKMARELAAKTGMAYLGAINTLRAAAQARSGAAARASEAAVVAVDKLPIGSRTAQQIVLALRAPHVSSVRVGHVRGGVFSNLKAMNEYMDELARNPKYFAKARDVDWLVSRGEHDALLDLGATADLRGVQTVRVPAPADGEPYAITCAHCRRWIMCGRGQRDGTCACGHAYRVVLDGRHAPSLERGERCMDCGKAFGADEPRAPLREWRRVNEGQMACWSCASMPHIGPYP